MNKQWSVVTTLKRGWLTYVSTMFSINCLLNAISSCRLFEQWVQWKVGLRRLRRGGGRMTAAGRPRPRPQRTVVKRNPSKVGSRPLRSCTSMPLVLLYIAPWSQWSFCSTGDVCIAKQGSYRSTCSQKIRQFTIWYAGSLGRRDKWIVDQASDVPSIIFFFHDFLQNSLQKSFQSIFLFFFFL